jgi:hypothetical protein
LILSVSRQQITKKGADMKVPSRCKFARAQWFGVAALAMLLVYASPGAAQTEPARQAAPVVAAHFTLSNRASQVRTSDRDRSGPPTVRIWDACDPDSFNSKFGPGTCQPGHHGQTNFDDFFAEVQTDKIAGGWRFNPLLNASDGAFKLVRLNVQRGERLTLENVGGETHTFTKVREFAGGFFAPLNPITGNPDPAPECAKVLSNGQLAPQPPSDTNQFVPAGQTVLGPFAGTPMLPLGVTHWQCCIHPWMRLDIVVGDHDHDHDQGHN